MKRWNWIISGLLLAIVGYCAVYFPFTSKERELLRESQPEMAWLKKEFHLNDAEYERICELHKGYLPKCEEICRSISAKNAELKSIFAQTNALTRDTEKKLAEIAELRAKCQAQMLQHFFAVSRVMPPEQGKRYLEWVQEKTILHPHGKETMSEMHDMK